MGANPIDFLALVVLAISPDSSGSPRAVDRIAGGQGGPPAPVVVVRQLPQRVGCWSVTETPNFRVYHRQRPDLGEQAAQVGERTRAVSFRKWFGAADEDWQQHCAIYLHATGADYSQATGVSAEVPGHTTVQRDGKRVLERRIDLHCDTESMLEAVLPHEVTHVVMAGKFGEQRPPLWASEAMAILAEPRDVLDSHQRNLQRSREEQQLYSVAQLVRLQGYPQPSQLRSYYAQSVSVVAMLAEEKGPLVFTQFLRDGLQHGYERSLRQHYDWDFVQLERAWQQYAFSERPNRPAVAQRPGR